MCQMMHSSISVLSEEYKQELKRINYVTPTTYLELISLFKSILQKSNNELTTRRNGYKAGIEKLV